MARRGRNGNGEAAIDLVALLPWWLSLMLAVLSYLVFHAVARPPVITSARPDQIGPQMIRSVITGVAFGSTSRRSSASPARSPRL